MANNIGTLIAAPVRPVAEADTFPTHYGNEGKGGCHNYASVAERDAIPPDRLYDNMIASVGNQIHQYDEASDTWEVLYDPDAPVDAGSF